MVWLKANKAIIVCSEHSVSFPTSTCHLIYSPSQTPLVQLFALNANPILELESIPVAYLFPDVFSEELGFIHPSTSTIFVKKDKSDRLVVDYLPLNEKTIKNTYPVPRFNEFFYQLAGASVFSKMDLRSGYHQIKSAKRMYPKQSSNSLWPLRYTVFSFDLSNAPATSSRLMLHFHGVSG